MNRILADAEYDIYIIYISIYYLFIGFVQASDHVILASKELGLNSIRRHYDKSIRGTKLKGKGKQMFFLALFLGGV